MIRQRWAGPYQFEKMGMKSQVISLVGGWTNPIETYARQNGFIFPLNGGQK